MLHPLNLSKANVAFCIFSRSQSPRYVTVVENLIQGGGVDIYPVNKIHQHWCYIELSVSSDAARCWQIYLCTSVAVIGD